MSWGVEVALVLDTLQSTAAFLKSFDETNKTS